ncbi:MAG: hypothetical protein KJ838_05935, partial [Candidatus Omnitrophica bacterium]|nr:hypothetical protein [Candidatus Omnitrophota bacterium]
FITFDSVISIPLNYPAINQGHPRLAEALAQAGLPCRSFSAGRLLANRGTSAFAKQLSRLASSDSPPKLTVFIETYKRRRTPFKLIVRVSPLFQ